MIIFSKKIYHESHKNDIGQLLLSKGNNQQGKNNGSNQSDFNEYIFTDDKQANGYLIKSGRNSKCGDIIIKVLDQEMLVEGDKSGVCKIHVYGGTYHGNHNVGDASYYIYTSEKEP